MPDLDVDFTISIPISEEDSQKVIDAFLSTKPYNTDYQMQVRDLADNLIINPITPAMYVEDCVAYFIMDITKNYLVNQAADVAKTIAQNEAEQITNELRNFINNN